MKITKSRLFGLFVFIIIIAFVLSVTFRAKNKTHNEIAGQPDLKIKAKDLNNTIVTPHIEQEITAGSNILWCSTFQLAWNEFCDLAGGPIEMESPPSIVPILNKRTASKEDLDENSYVAMAGLAEEGIYEKIRAELDKKFKGQASPDLFDSIPKMEWVAYAYLFKELPFEWAFDRFNQKLIFEGYYVDSFGIEQLIDVQKNEVKMASQVVVLDYNDEDDFIIELKTQAKDDRLILAKISPEASIGETISIVEKRIEKAKPAKMNEMTNLFIPILNFDILKEYSELYGHSIHSTNENIDKTSIGIALQSVRFRLDERGTILKSESIMAAGIGDNLVFDKPFLILLKRHDAKKPYFALWVGNAELLVPAKKKPAKEKNRTIAF